MLLLQPLQPQQAVPPALHLLLLLAKGGSSLTNALHTRASRITSNLTPVASSKITISLKQPQPQLVVLPVPHLMLLLMILSEVIAHSVSIMEPCDCNQQ